MTYYSMYPWQECIYDFTIHDPTMFDDLDTKATTSPFDDGSGCSLPPSDTHSNPAGSTEPITLPMIYRQLEKALASFTDDLPQILLNLPGRNNPVVSEHLPYQSAVNKLPV